MKRYNLDMRDYQREYETDVLEQGERVASHRESEALGFGPLFDLQFAAYEAEHTAEGHHCLSCDYDPTTQPGYNPEDPF